MRNLLTNDQLLNELQETVDDAEIQEQADEILELVMDLDIGEHEKLHDIYGNQCVHVYRSEAGFNLHSVSYDIAGNDIKSHFSFDDYECGFDSVEGFDYEALAERKIKREAIKVEKAESRLLRFLRIEKAYDDGDKNISHPYLTAKGLAPADINIEYSVIKADLFQAGNPLELLIYKCNDDTYQVITPAKINGTNKFNIIRKEGVMKGSYAVVGDGEPKLIVEGLADAITVNMALGRSVAVGINAGNIKVVAQEFPDLILIGDNDDAGRLSAKQSGLDSIFCPDHKDVDDFRQDKGLIRVKRYLEHAVILIMRNREPILGESNRRITLVTAPPGSGKSYIECQNLCQRTGLTIYAVHNKKAMGQEDSRVSDIRMLCDENSYPLPTIRKVNDSESEDTIALQFQKALADYNVDDNADKNWVVFITHKGLSLLNFDSDIPNDTTLVIDEVPDAYQIINRRMTRENLNTFLQYFDVTVKNCTNHYVVSIHGLRQQGRIFFGSKTNKLNAETSIFWGMIEKILSSRNHSNFFIINKSELGHVHCVDSRNEDYWPDYAMYVGEEPKIYEAEIFDSSAFDSFSNVRLLSDDVEHSVLALLLKNTQGVQFDIERLPSRHVDGIAHRIESIIGITESSFSKHKIDTRPDLSNNIARAIAERCDLSNSLWLLNNSSRDNGDAIVWLKEQGYEVDDFNPMTHGRNDLTRFDTVVMLYSLKPNPYEVALLEHLGVSQAEITRWREHNVHMQNAFRCFLRNPGGDTAGTLVFPDKASIEYFLGRIEDVWGIEQRELVEAKVSYITDEVVMADFADKKVGRKPSGDEPLTKSEKNKLSLWRKKYPDLNDFAQAIGKSLKELVSFKARQIGELYTAWTEAAVKAIEDTFDDCGFAV